MRGFFIATLILAFSVNVSRSEEAVSLKTGLRGISGTGGYRGRGAYLQYGDIWRVRANYSDYRFNSSTGTTRTAGLRTDYQSDNAAFGLVAMVTPRNDFYENRAFGADGDWAIPLGESFDAASSLSEVEFGLWWLQTRHSQIVPATPILPQKLNVIINQHDLGLSLAFTEGNFTLSADIFRSLYDQDVSAIPAAASLRPSLGETAALVNGFPASGAAARLDFSRWPALIPSLSLTATHYAIQPRPATLASNIGIALKHGGLDLNLGYEIVRQKGSPDSKYFNFSGSFNFQ